MSRRLNDSVIGSEVQRSRERSAWRSPRHKTNGRKASLMGDERIKSPILECFPNTTQRCLDFARHDNNGTENRNESTSKASPIPRFASKRGRRLSYSGF